MSAQPQACRFTIADGGNVFGGSSESVTWHVAVHTLVLPGLVQEGFVPDSDTTVGTNSLVEVFPRLQVGVGGIADKLLKLFEATPVLNSQNLAPAYP